MIKIMNVSKRYKKKKNSKLLDYAIKNLSFEIEAGDSVGYIGANGSGKSTTIKMIAGLLKPSSGNVQINGLDTFENRKKIVKNIGIIFGQRSSLIWDLPAIDTFKLNSKIYGLSQKEYEVRLKELIEIMDAKGFVDVPVRRLSLGQRMCCEIIAAMIHSPNLLLFDEPTIGLDFINKERIRKFIKDINQGLKTTVIITTHDMDDINYLCDRIIVIDKGEKIYDGKLEEIKSEFGYVSTVIVETDKVCQEKLYLKEMLEVISKGNLTTIKFDNRQYNNKKIIEILMEKIDDIKDLKFVENDFENIIKNIYLKKV